MSFHVSTQFWLCSSIFRVYLQSPEGRFGSSPLPWSCHGPGRPSAGSCSSQSSLSCWAFQRKVYKSYMWYQFSVFGMSWHHFLWVSVGGVMMFSSLFLILWFSVDSVEVWWEWLPSWPPSAQPVRTTLQAFRSPHEQWPLKTLGNAVAKEGQGVESKLEMAGDFCKTVAHGASNNI
jgi:hypothetical protein